LLGHRLPGEEHLIRQKIGRVSVDAAFYKKLSARENLLYSALLYGLEARAAERRALEILEQLGLEGERFTDPLEEMSRGMQQAGAESLDDAFIKLAGESLEDETNGAAKKRNDGAVADDANVHEPEATDEAEVTNEAAA